MSKNLSKLFRAQAGEARRAPRKVSKIMDSPESSSQFTTSSEFTMNDTSCDPVPKSTIILYNKLKDEKIGQNSVKN